MGPTIRTGLANINTYDSKDGNARDHVMECLSEELVAAWRAHVLAAPDVARATDHAADCARCRQLLGALLRGEPYEAKRLVGRYEVISTLAAGGMGMVLRAHDTLLRRDVAVKLLHRPTHPSSSGLTLLDEARALAKVRHANVVPIHDVGEAEGEIYVAMELIEGRSLAEWMAAQPRAWEARLGVAGDIGRGLQAIHAAGLVHRDLKPSNIMIKREDDRDVAVIVDLGLASVDARARAQGLGGIAGTPGFMAPEVAAGGQATAASDQFQWWALLRDGLGLTEDARAPAALRQASARGLANAPGDRFATIADALSALAQAVHPRRGARAAWRWVALAGGLAVVGGLVWGLWSRAALRDPAALCRANARVGWSAAELWATTNNLRRHRLPLTTAHWLEARSKRAGALAVAYCQAESTTLADRRLACVRGAWRATSPIIARLASPEFHEVLGAIDGLATLLPVDRCDRGPLLSVPEPLTPALAQRQAAAIAKLHAIADDAGLTTNQKQTALVAEAEQVAALGNRLVEARWYEARARVWATHHDMTQAARDFAKAFALAAEAGDDPFSAAVLVTQMMVTPPTASADARAHLQATAAALVGRVQNPYWAAQLAYAEGLMAMTLGQATTGTERLASAAAQLAAISLQPHVEELRILQNLAAMQLEAGDPRVAQQTLATAMAKAEQRHLSRTAMYWELRGAWAMTFTAAGDVVRSARELSLAATGLQRHQGDPLVLGQLRAYLAAAQFAMGQAAEARVVAEQAIAEISAASGAGSPALVWPLLVAGQSALGQRDDRAALGYLQRVAATCDAGNCREIERVVAQAYLAIALHRTGQPVAALRLVRGLRVALAQPALQQARADVRAAFGARAK